MRLKITIAYDGTNYAGWQVQKNAISIQSLVQKAIEIVLRHPIQLSGSGRTDAGVHALGQTAHFDTDVDIDLSRLCYSANALLPLDIRILKAEKVKDDFHARYSAVGKTYHYHLQIDPVMDPKERLYRTQIFGPFDRSLLEKAIPHLIGGHDFTSFSNVRKNCDDTIRTLHRLDVFDEPGGIRLEFVGDGFLYKMVRNIVGTLIDVAAGRTLPDDIPKIFQGKNRKLAGPAALPQGLFLISVQYLDHQEMHKPFSE
jgi:tRNA pseudouridine38-40 synthase